MRVSGSVRQDDWQVISSGKSVSSERSDAVESSQDEDVSADLTPQ